MPRKRETSVCLFIRFRKQQIHVVKEGTILSNYTYIDTQDQCMKLTFNVLRLIYRLAIFHNI